MEKNKIALVLIFQLISLFIYSDETLYKKYTSIVGAVKFMQIEDKYGGVIYVHNIEYMEKFPYDIGIDSKIFKFKIDIYEVNEITTSLLINAPIFYIDLYNSKNVLGPFTETNCIDLEQLDYFKTRLGLRFILKKQIETNFLPLNNQFTEIRYKNSNYSNSGFLENIGYDLLLFATAMFLWNEY